MLEQRVEERTKELSESEAKYRDLFETVQEVFCIDRLIYDEEGNVVDWVFEDLNPAGLRPPRVQGSGSRPKERGDRKCSAMRSHPSIFQ